VHNLDITVRDDQIIGQELVDLIFLAGESIKGYKVGGNKLIYYRQEFLYKYLQHFVSVLYLSKGTTVKAMGEQKIFYDMSSINVLIRAALETYLLFHYIYADGSDNDTIGYRFWSWLREGLLLRQTVRPTSQETITKLKEEKEEIRKIEDKIRSNKWFKSLSEKQRKNYMTKGKWRDRSWKQLAKSAGFSDSLSETIYSFLSGYAHSESISVIQLATSPDYRTAKELNSIMLKFLFMSCGLFINSFRKVFSDVEFNFDEYQKEVVETWQYLASTVAAGKSQITSADTLSP
jgi:hypothetical protein